MADVVCETCAYWQPKVGGAQSYGFPGDDRAPKGQCRRYSPTLQRTDAGMRPMWPLVRADWWCGEHGVVEQARQSAGEAAA